MLLRVRGKRRISSAQMPASSLGAELPIARAAEPVVRVALVVPEDPVEPAVRVGPEDAEEPAVRGEPESPGGTEEPAGGVGLVVPENPRGPGVRANTAGQGTP